MKGRGMCDRMGCRRGVVHGGEPRCGFEASAAVVPRTHVPHRLMRTVMGSGTLATTVPTRVTLTRCGVVEWWWWGGGGVVGYRHHPMRAP